MSKLEALVELQDIDTRRLQIAHVVKNLPQRSQRREVEAAALELEPAVAKLTEQLDALAQLQSVREKESTRLEEKIQADSLRLYQGTITSPKEAEALSHEIESLQEHLRAEEDVVLELMEKADPLLDELAELNTQQTALAEQLVELDEQIAAAQAEATTSDAAVAAERSTLVVSMDADLLALYEQHQKSASGQAAVGLLEAGTCMACNLSLSSGERDRIMALNVDEPTDCPECGALLVRASSKTAQ